MNKAWEKCIVETGYKESRIMDHKDILQKPEDKLLIKDHYMYTGGKAY